MRGLRVRARVEWSGAGGGCDGDARNGGSRRRLLRVARGRVRWLCRRAAAGRRGGVACLLLGMFGSGLHGSVVG